MSEQEQRRISDIPLVELKAAAWDLSVLMEELRRRLHAMQSEIAERQKKEAPNGA